MNYLAILVCAIASMVVGFIWYGPLFGKQWMAIMGADTMTQEQKDVMKKSMGAMYFLQFILSLITITVLSYHISHWTGDTSAVAIAVCSWFGFIMTTHASGALWSGKPKKVAIKMFLLSAGAQLVSFIVFGIILGLWK